MYKIKVTEMTTPHQTKIHFISMNLKCRGWQMLGTENDEWGFKNK